MVDPVLTFLNALWLIFQRLPLPFQSLVGVVAVFGVVIILFKIVRAL